MPWHRATALAALTPTSSDPARPGPEQAATASMSDSVRPASTSAWAMTGLTSSRWARLAISGTTPPKRAWRSPWLATTDDRRLVPSSTTPTAVSSQEVSMPRMFTVVLSQGLVLHLGGAGYAVLDGGEEPAVVVAGDVLGPHHEGVLLGLGVVVLAHADRPEPETPVQVLGRLVGQAHLQRQAGGPPPAGLPGQGQEETGADLVAVPGRVDGNGGDVPVVEGHHQPGVADHLPADEGHVVGPGGAQRQLRQEQRHAPRHGVDLRLDPQHRAEVAAAHGHQADVEVAGFELGGHHRACFTQFISASDSRRYSGCTSRGWEKSSRWNLARVSSTSAETLG